PLALCVAATLLLASPLCAQAPPDRNAPAASQGVDRDATAVPPAQTAPETPDVGTSETRPASKATPPAPRELSAWTMFLSADPLVKAVMVSLAFASLVTWTIFLAKSVKLGLVRWRLRRALARVSAAATVSEAQLAVGRSRSVLAAMVADATHELRKSSGVSDVSGIKERVASTFSEVGRAEAPWGGAGNGLARDHRRHLAVRGPVRHGLGHHEQLHRHFKGPDDKSRRRRAGHRRGASGHGVRPCGGHSGRDHLQPLCTHNEGVRRPRD